ncbi:MAG: polymerase sigma factor, sigma-70 family [Ferruginibacter sp.]|uniref:RNA polymerase sigma factor n=1 Tax=Ferruginibacter sp. TaxID=1940288 RepID=UPI003467882B|nr:polymerase sigma factor, sigma-70 family [Ferruginibacter sp.]
MYLLKSAVQRLIFHSQSSKYGKNRSEKNASGKYNSGKHTAVRSSGQPASEKLITNDLQYHLFQLLIHHLNHLPARQKELIILKFYEGLSYEEIVQQTGLAPRTVYNKMHEALKKLKLEMIENPYSRKAMHA